MHNGVGVPHPQDQAVVATRWVQLPSALCPLQNVSGQTQVIDMIEQQLLILRGPYIGHGHKTTVIRPSARHEMADDLPLS